MTRRALRAIVALAAALLLSSCQSSAPFPSPSSPPPPPEPQLRRGNPLDAVKTEIPFETEGTVGRTLGVSSIWYVFDVNRSCIVAIDLTGETDADIDLFLSSGSESLAERPPFATSRGIHGDESITATLTPGSYAIEVGFFPTNSSSVRSAPFRLRVGFSPEIETIPAPITQPKTVERPQPRTPKVPTRPPQPVPQAPPPPQPAPVEPAPDPGSSSAIELPNGETTEVSISDANRFRWLRFSVKDQGILVTADLNCTIDRGEANVSLNTSDREVTGVAFGQTSRMQQVLDPGTYYLRITTSQTGSHATVRVTLHQTSDAGFVRRSPP